MASFSHPPGNAPLTPTKVYIPEVDILRGIAAVLMILNHLAVRILTPEQASQPILAALSFVGSFAPVVFFFVTGMGYGIQADGKPKAIRWGLIANKVLILLAADMVMHWSVGRWIGLDFLGFIGVSVLLLEVVRTLKWPIAACIVGIVGLTGLRFLVGPVALKLGYDQSIILVNWVLGTKEITGVSYPLTPWMVYPLLGFVVGAVTRRKWEMILQRRSQVVLALMGVSALPIVAGVGLALRGSTFFRWGTMNLGFYVVSFAPIAIGLACALLICSTVRLRSVQALLALQGVASLAVVPIHYFLIDLIHRNGIGVPDLFSFVVMVMILIAVSFLLARGAQKVSQRISQLPQQRWLWFGLVGLIVSGAIVTLALGLTNASIALLPRTVDQLLLCWLLPLRLPYQATKPAKQSA